MRPIFNLFAQVTDLRGNKLILIARSASSSGITP